MDCSFTLKGEADFLLKLEMYRTGVSMATSKSATEIKEFGLNAIHKRLYPGHGYRTGTLYHSYWGRVSGSAYSSHVTFGSDLYYAPFVEYRWGGKVSHFRPAMKEVEGFISKNFRGNINAVFGR